MKIARTGLVLLLAALAAGVTATSCKTMEHKKDKAGMEKQAAMTQAVYVCPDCHVMSSEPGKCTMCGKGLQEMHLLGIKKGKALLCACGGGCPCNAAGVKDGKCACGKEVKKVSAKGMYVCPNGCPEISKKPGKCMCGKEMKKVE